MAFSMSPEKGGVGASALKLDSNAFLTPSYFSNEKAFLVFGAASAGVSPSAGVPSAAASTGASISPSSTGTSSDEISSKRWKNYNLVIFVSSSNLANPLSF